MWYRDGLGRRGGVGGFVDLHFLCDYSPLLLHFFILFQALTPNESLMIFKTQNVNIRVLTDKDKIDYRRMHQKLLRIKNRKAKRQLSPDNLI